MSDDESEEGGVAIDVAVLLLVLLLMVEKEFRLEIVLALLEELKCGSDLI